MPSSPPTIDDLRVKLCYICRDEEPYDTTGPKQVFVHPCNCTLIAHESCLLEWIATAERNPQRKDSLKCPQCGTQYELISDKPRSLRILNRLGRVLAGAGRGVLLCTAGTLFISFGAGIYTFSTLYGAHAARQFLGTQLYELSLTDDPALWPWQAWIMLPSIPLLLITSGTSLFYPLWSILAVPVLPAGLRGAPYTSARQMIKDIFFSWPPSLLLLNLTFPLARAAYKIAFARLAARVLGIPVGSAHTRGPIRELIWAMGQDGQPNIRVNIQAGQQALEDAAPQPAAEAPAAEGAQAPGAQAQDDQAPGNNMNRPQAGINAPRREDRDRGTIVITGGSLGRIIGGALLMPSISNAMGALLAKISQFVPLLRRFLAIRPQRIAVSPLRRMTPWTQLGLITQGPRLFFKSNGTLPNGMHWVDYDPVWWRNSIGLGLYVLARDCISLYHLYLSDRERKSRRVVSRSFEGVDVSELDLIDSPLETKH